MSLFKDGLTYKQSVLTFSPSIADDTENQTNQSLGLQAKSVNRDNGSFS